MITALLRAIALILLPGDLRQLDVALDGQLERARRAYPGGLPGNLLSMLVIAEDHRFLSHGGFDAIAATRAVSRTLLHAQVQGGSTIEQQLVRVITGRYERTLRRKIREILLATVVSTRITKLQIATLYLSIAYYGWRMTDLAHATRSLAYDLNALPDEEAAKLVALIKYPAQKDPDRWAAHMLKLSRRVAHILFLALLEIEWVILGHFRAPGACK